MSNGGGGGSMRAVVVEEFGAPEVLQIREVPVPQPGAGQVAIDVEYAGVNYAEVIGRRGALPIVEAPFVPGLEVSGSVRALGAGVEGFKVGQLVTALTTVGGYAEVAVAPAAVTYPLADADGDLVTAAAFPVVVPTAWALINEVARLRVGESVLVHAAAGGVGSVAGQVARLAGASPIFGIVSTSEKARQALDFGYDEVFHGFDWAERAREANEGRGIDAILDSVGGETREQGLELLAPLGRLTIFGNASEAPEAGVPGSVLRRQSKGVAGYSIASLTAAAPERSRAIGEAALAAVAAGDIELVVSKVMPLEKVHEAHELLEGRSSTGKLVLAI